MFKIFAKTAPYDTRGQRDTLNSGDNIYAGGGASTVLNVKRARNRKGKATRRRSRSASTPDARAIRR